MPDTPKLPDLPPCLGPFFSSHPASSAYRVCQPESEWEWSHDEQVAMAQAIVQLDAERHYRKIPLDRVERRLRRVELLVEYTAEALGKSHVVDDVDHALKYDLELAKCAEADRNLTTAAVHKMG